MNLGEFSDLSRDEKRKAIERLESELTAMKSMIGVVRFDHVYKFGDDSHVVVTEDLDVGVYVSGHAEWMCRDEWIKLFRVLELTYFEHQMRELEEMEEQDEH